MRIAECGLIQIRSRRFPMALEEGLVQPIGLYRATLTVTRASQHVSTAGLVGAMDASGKHAVPTIETGRKAPHPSALVDVNLVRGPRAMETAYSEIDRTGRLDAVVTALRASMSSLTDLRILESEGDFVRMARLHGAGAARGRPRCAVSRSRADTRRRAWAS